MKKILIYILLSLPSMALPQQQLTLKDAINTAIENNFDVQIARNESEISRLYNSFGMSGGLPAVNFTGTENNSVYNLKQKLNSGVEINKDDVSNNSVNTGLTANMYLFNGFKIIATKERLKMLQEQSELLLNHEIQNTIAAVMMAYYDIIRQQNYLKIIQSTLDMSIEKLHIITEKQKAGMSHEADVLQALIDKNTAEQNLKSEQVVIEQAKINLLQLMGVKDFYTISINDTITTDPNILKENIFNYLEKNPQYLSAAQQIRINEQVVKEVKAQRYPSIKINTGYNYIYNRSTAGFNLFTQNYGPALGATLQIPIFNGFVYKTQQDVALLQVKNAELHKNQLMLSLKSDAEQTYLLYSNMLQQLESQQNNFENAGKLMHIVMQKCNLNQSTILDMKAAQLSYENAGYMLINLQYATKTAEIELKRLTNQLTY